MTSEEDTQKREQVVAVTSSNDTDKVTSVVDQVLSDTLFEERTHQYVQKYMKRWNFSPAWHVDICVVSKEEMPKQEAKMEWDWGGILYARLKIRQDIPEELHEWLVAHEMMHLFERRTTMAVHAIANQIDDERLCSELLALYYREQEELIEEALTIMFGESRKYHLLRDEETPAEHPAVLPLPVVPDPVTPLPEVHPSFQAQPVTPLPEVHIDFQTQEIPVEELLTYEDTSETEEEVLEPIEHKAVYVPDVKGGSIIKEVEEGENGWLLDEMSDEDKQILAKLHELGANKSPSFFASQTQMVLPVTPVPFAPLADVSSPVKQPSQPLVVPIPSVESDKSPFSRCRLTPLQEQNAAWTLETIQMPVLSLPVKQEKAKNPENTAKNEGKSYWERMKEQLCSRTKGL